MEEHTKGVETLNPYRYTGREYDTDDLYYYRARYYDPTIGRFITPDPIGYLSGDFNFYRYVGNDPVNFIDPSGLMADVLVDYSIKGLQNFAGAVNAATGGITGGIAEQINTVLYGEEVALANTAAMEGTISAQAVEVFDYVNPKGWLKNGLKKGFKLLKPKKKAASSKKNNGTKIKGLKKKKVKCFCPDDHAKGGRDEYERQLKNQQDGINNTTAEEYIQRRNASTGSKDICSDKQPMLPRKDSKDLEEAKDKWFNQQSEKFTDEFREKGIPREKAESLANAKANRDIYGTEVGVFKKDGTPKFNKDGTQRIKHVGGEAPLHNQDMRAGGKPQIGDGSGVYNRNDFGSSDVNRHIGTQWNSERGEALDDQACEAMRNGDGKEKMNVELRVCGKKEAKKNKCPKNSGKTEKNH